MNDPTPAEILFTSWWNTIQPLLRIQHERGHLDHQQLPVVQGWLKRAFLAGSEETANAIGAQLEPEPSPICTCPPGFRRETTGHRFDCPVLQVRRP